jgi:hypothetical protein
MRQSVIVLLLLLSSLTFSQDFSKLQVSVKELPPEPFPVGTCKQDLSGYIGIVKDGKEETNLTDKQLGEYVRMRLAQGYSVTLYPQASGRTYAIATCHSGKS